MLKKKKKEKKSSGKLFTTSKGAPDQIPIISRPAEKLDEGDGWAEEQGGVGEKIRARTSTDPHFIMKRRLLRGGGCCDCAGPFHDL